MNQTHTTEKAAYGMAERVESKACDKAADLLWNESMDDYAAATLAYLDDGSVQVAVATGDSTWDSLRNVTQDRVKAEELSAMRIGEDWRMVDTGLFGRVQVRTIEDVDGIARGYLFKR